MKDIPYRTNLKVNQGSTKSWTLYIKTDGINTDITGWTIYFMVKTNQEDTDANAVITKTITSHTDATNGKTTIPLTVADTSRTGSYHYELSYKDDESTPNQDVLMTGRIKFEKTVQDSRS
jgi:hypothetical protein